MIYSPHLTDVYIGSSTADDNDEIFESVLSSPPKCIQNMIDEGDLEIKTLECSVFKTKKEHDEALWNHKKNHWNFCVNRIRAKGLRKKFIYQPASEEQKRIGKQVMNELIETTTLGEYNSNELKKIKPIKGNWFKLEEAPEKIEPPSALGLIKKRIAHI
jgi:hypothetical protein